MVLRILLQMKLREDLLIFKISYKLEMEHVSIHFGYNFLCKRLSSVFIMGKWKKRILCM